MSDEGESVQVAVRMRCFNKREIEAGSERVVRMERLLKGSNTFIKNPETGEEKKFNYDFSFQSHSTTEAGIGDFASQDVVFEELGRPVMESSLEGRNVCLFAYGQTGSGKSFSMLGKPGELGIIPRTCNAIFSKIGANTDDSLEFTVDIQVVEIYCEQVNDLLADRKSWPQAGHKPRLTDKGYVVDTVRKPCFKYADIESAFNFADKNRSVGSHALNPESSRAHTIYTINYERRKRHSSGKVIETVFARLNLVDLAGSERTESAGTSGQMLKEGNAINLSLTALGSCIKSLSENKKPNYRDSKLTLLLQGSMTNGRVVMIAALSPSGICYDESVSTLRFADRIKQVKIKVSKNITTDPVAEMKKAMDDMRSKMQAEIENLRSRATTGNADPEVMDELQTRLKEQSEGVQSMREEYERKMREAEESQLERVKRAEEISKMQSNALGGASLKRKEDVKEPHFLNLHEDSRLAETLVYPFKAGTTVIGRMCKDHPPDLEFNGMGIVKNHATVKFDNGKVTLSATTLNNGRTLVNGKLMGKEEIELKHNMRVWLGNNYAFRFAFPGKEAAGEQFKEVPDYVFAEQEIAENSSFEASTGKDSKVATAINQKLSDALKKVEQANIIAADLGKRCEFEAKIFKNRITGENDIVVRVNSEKGEMHWPWEKFTNRVVDFSKEWQQWQHCEEKGEKYVRAPEIEDPFQDSEFQLIGEADVWLQSLANMIEHHADPSLLAITGQCEGRIHVDICPCDKNGKEGPWDDDEENDPFVDDPKYLLNSDLRFVIKIHNVVFDTTKTSQVCKFSNTWVRYKVNLLDSEEEWSQTEEVTNPSFNPKFSFRKEHILHVDQQVLSMLLKGRIVFQVWGKLSKDSSFGPGMQLSGKKGELAKLEADILARKNELVELEEKIKNRRKELAANR